MNTQNYQSVEMPSSEQTPTVPSVLLVEDNLRVSNELALVLESGGYNIRCAYDGEHMRSLLAVYIPNVVILDLNLPSEDGISLCKWLRGVYPNIGIVMLTARVMGRFATQRSAEKTAFDGFGDVQNAQILTPGGHTRRQVP